jgi:hypothetical protein
MIRATVRAVIAMERQKVYARSELWPTQTPLEELADS